MPSGELELALWMESDRMGFLLPALTEKKFVNQRDVVLNERRQNYENRPYGMSSMAVLAALFPPDHPYHWSTIGDIADLQAARLEEAHDFFRRYYHPANASLALAGDIDPDAALSMVRGYFEGIEPGTPVDKVRAEASLDGERRILLEDRVELPRLYLAWLTPAMFADGDAALDLAADVLANGKTSRLYRRLVFEERIATDVSAAQNSRELCGFAQISATAAPGHTLPELERVIVEEVDRLSTDGPTDDEIDRGRVQAETQFMQRLQTVGGFGGKSDQLNAYNTFLGRPDYFNEDRRSLRTRHEELAAGRGREVPAGRRSRDAERRPARPRRPRDRQLGAGQRPVTPETPPAVVDRSRLPPLRAVPKFSFPVIAEVDAREWPWRVDGASSAGADGRSGAARAQLDRPTIRPGRKVSRRSRRTCSTRAPARDPPSTSTRTSRESARSSTPTSVRTRWSSA